MSRKSFIMGCTFVAIGVLFVLYALNHPESSFPWPNRVTYLGYFVYFCVTVACFIASAKIKNERNL